MPARSPSTKYPSSIRVFESDFLERFTHVHPITPLLLWGPVALFLFWRAFNVHDLPIASVVGIAAFAVLIWTLMEYLLHRYVFHFRAESPQERRLQFLIHGLHHDDPNDGTRLVMPPVAAIILAILHWALFRAIFGPVWVEPFFAGFLVGYLCYDYSHFAVHHFTPRTAFGRWVKKHHMQHHFVTPHARYGVSSPLWDFVFGTYDAAPAGAGGSHHREEGVAQG